MTRSTMIAVLLCLAPSLRAEDQACRAGLGGLVQAMNAVRYTCTSRCSQSNLWLLFGAASGPTAQKAYDALADRCETSGMHIVDSQLSCIANYGVASYHEDLDDDCEARAAILKAELTTVRMRCTAKFSSRSDWPYEATADVANAARAFSEFAQLADKRDFSFRSFAPAIDCVAVQP